MKNLMKKKLLPSAVSVVLAAGIGFSGGAQAIHVSEDGMGQVLLAPFYLTEFTYNSEVEIANTRSDVAVKTKVVLRSHVSSEELLDFICYMTPSDVCRFELVQACGIVVDDKAVRPDPVLPLNRDCPDEQQYVFMRSTDDSIKSPLNDAESVGLDRTKIVDSLERTSATFASVKEVIIGLAIPPRNARDRDGKPIPPSKRVQSLTSGDMLDSQRLGHIEVYGAYAVKNHPRNDRAKVVGYNSRNDKVLVDIREGMSKFALAQVFDTPRARGSISALIHRPGAKTLEDSPSDKDDVSNAPFESDERGYGYASLVDSRIRSTDPTWVKLMGTVKMQRQDSSGRIVDRMGYRIPALSGAIGSGVFYQRDTNGNFTFSKPEWVLDIVGRNDDGSPVWHPDHPNKVVATPDPTANFDGLVIANNTYDVTVAAEAGVGSRFGLNGLSKTVEIERALASSEVIGTFYDESRVSPIVGPNRTNLIVTFPTRYMHFQQTWCGSPGIVWPRADADFPNVTNDFSAPFREEGYIEYELTAYDDSENPSTLRGIPFSPFRASESGKLVETNYFLPEWPVTRLNADGSVVMNTGDFRKGWFHMNFSGDEGCPYTGVPVLAFSHRATAYEDVGITNSHILPLSKK